VTSVPIGAKVLVAGKDMGTTPLTLKLGKKKPHAILTILVNPIIFIGK
jgi:hypothetical protein